jgi:hypothetical protein
MAIMVMNYWGTSYDGESYLSNAYPLSLFEASIVTIKLDISDLGRTSTSEIAEKEGA